MERCGGYWLVNPTFQGKHPIIETGRRSFGHERHEFATSDFLNRAATRARVTQEEGW